MVTVICAVAIVIAVLVICLQDKVITSDEVTQIKAAVMNLVVAAQKEYGDGCGLFKLEVVKAALAEKFPKLFSIFDEDEVEELISAAKDKLVTLAEDNDKIAEVANIIVSEVTDGDTDEQ